MCKSGQKLFWLTILLSVLSALTASFLEQPSDATVSVGQNVIFRCRLDRPGNKGSLKWMRGLAAAPVVRNERLVISADGSQLTITNAQLEDVGFYRCQYGSAPPLWSRRARLVVVQRREKPRITHRSGECPHGHNRMIFPRPMNVEVPKGSTVRLSCGAIAFPPPVHTWFKDGGRLSSAHDRYEVKADGTLVIVNAQLDDSAHFRCSVSNYLGRAGFSARVKVNPDEPNSNKMPEYRPCPLADRILL